MTRSQNVVHDQVAHAVSGDQRVIGRPAALVRIRTELGALLSAVERLDRAVDVQRHLRLLAQSLDDNLAQKIEQRFQQLPIFEAPQVAVEHVEVGKAIDAVTGAQQRLGFEVLEVIQPLDPREVRVEQDPDHPIERPGRPVGLGPAKARCQALLELLFDQEPAEVIEAAQGGRAREIESLLERGQVKVA